MTAPLTGTTSNGVPYLAVPPAGDAATAPVIILWHLMDAPRSVAAFAAALPLDGLDAWKVYLGLPTFGARSLPGGVDEVMKLLATDAPGLVHGPVHSRAAELPLWLVDPATTRATNENAAADGQGVTNDSTHLWQ